MKFYILKILNFYYLFVILFLSIVNFTKSKNNHMKKLKTFQNNNNNITENPSLEKRNNTNNQMLILPQEILSNYFLLT